jgi:hypothetical protein
MDNFPIIGRLKDIFNSMEAAFSNLSHKTEELENFLVNYNIESSNPNDLIEIIIHRENIVAEITQYNKELINLQKELELLEIKDPKFELDHLKNSILARIQKIMATDLQNRERIIKLQETLKDQLFAIKNGKKFTQAYEIVPHRKAIFVDTAINL